MIGEFAAGLALSAAGLLPLLHPNLVLSLANSGSSLGDGVFAASLASAHLVFALFAGIVLLVPSSAGAMLPLAGGQTTQAVAGAIRTSVKAFAAATALSVALVPISMAVFPIAAQVVKPLVPWLVLATVALFAAGERNLKKAALGIAVFLLAAMVGFIALNSTIAREPLLPLLTGLFGLPAVLAVTARESGSDAGVAGEPKASHIAAGTVLGACSGFLPAMTPAFVSSAAFLATGADWGAFLAINASVVASKNFFDFANAFSLGKARSGPAAVALEAFGNAGDFAGTYSAIVLAASAAAAFAACAVLAVFGPRIASVARGASGKSAIGAVAVSVVVLVFALEGLGGIAIMAAAASVGILAAALGVRPAYASGALIGPSLAYQFGLAGSLSALA